MSHPFRNILQVTTLYPVLVLDFWWSERLRHFVIALTRALLIVFLTAFAVLPWVSHFNYFGQSLLWWQNTTVVIAGFWFILAGFWTLASGLELFFRFNLFRSLERRAEGQTSFLVGKLLYATAEADLVIGFWTSPFGHLVLARLGLNSLAPDSLIQGRRAKPQVSALNFKPGEILTLEGLAALLLAANPDMAKWLAGFSLGEIELRGAAKWVEQRIDRAHLVKRWWSRGRLDRVPGLAKDWSYGATYYLDRFSEDLLSSAEVSRSHLTGVAIYEAEAKLLADILGKRLEANALVLGESVDERLAVVWELARQVRAGAVRPELEHKRVILWRAADFLANITKSQELERNLSLLLSDAAASGNVVLIIDDLVALLLAADNLGVRLQTVLDPYLVSGRLQLVAMLDQANFNQQLAKNETLINRFERLLLEPPSKDKVIELLEGATERLEQNGNLLISYPALLELVTAAERYFADMPLSEKSLNLLVELVSWSENAKKFLLDREAVFSFIKEKTHVPLGHLSVDERSRLANLPDLLGAKIVGQAEAVELVSSALKRARTGITSDKRPISSFLFLGPTGVGKTETAKALAEVFFGGEDNLIRLDMSEYETDEALTRLTGSFNSGKAGLLATAIRQKPYGVALFDEFEKTRPEVLNLFLQILDEGFFTDALGHKVNARNLVVVATSNAGADFVWQMIKDKKPEAEWRAALIDEVIKRGIFKPELLNRFDAAIIFKPLSPEALNGVAKIMLERLARRLSGQGLELAITPALLERVTSSGANQAFGARPMQRFIQDKIEAVIADQLVTGQLKSGMKIDDAIFL
ncbi:MAG: AAA family ATPase [Patescibacteria group bacterium]